MRPRHSGLWHFVIPGRALARTRNPETEVRQSTEVHNTLDSGFRLTVAPGMTLCCATPSRSPPPKRTGWAACRRMILRIHRALWPTVIAQPDRLTRSRRLRYLDHDRLRFCGIAGATAEAKHESACNKCCYGDDISCGILHRSLSANPAIEDRRRRRRKSIFFFAAENIK
jgi:hypothetical protein